ncbi:hypothetical protein TK50_27450 [Micromonospora haikouensis]|uniref:Tetratricopeptide repeat-containing protein n=1 Tax=Micromonospora haikouensis TaxID=686309 RepID=A0A0D0WRP0_9ACTN|nr:hypothetical protein TK50_27450 [Micromonospora haikouensis]
MFGTYLRAAHLQFPYGHVSWFDAGQVHGQLGRADLAAECYRRSLAHWPTGVTPLRRLRDLHLRGRLPDDGGVLAVAPPGHRHAGRRRCRRVAGPVRPGPPSWCTRGRAAVPGDHDGADMPAAGGGRGGAPRRGVRIDRLEPMPGP